MVTTPSGRIVAGTFAVIIDQSMQDGMAYTEKLRAELNRIAWSHGVEFDGPASVLMTDDELVAWLDLVEAAGVQAAATHQDVDHPANPVAVVPMIGAARDLTSLTGPVITNGDPWRLANKLTKKAGQAVEAGGDWIRVDVLDGLWQFTEWARWPLAQKAEAIAAQVRQAVGGINDLLGRVVSCGPAMGRGDFTDEDVVVSGGSFALRRIFTPFRVGETIIVPTRTEVEARVAGWVRVYDAKPAWLGARLGWTPIGSRRVWTIGPKPVPGMKSCDARDIEPSSTG